LAKPALNLANDFIAHLNHLKRIRAKMERLMQSGDLVRANVEQVYSGLYLDAITSFESLIENLFVGLIVGRLKSDLAEVQPRICISSNRVAREIVLGGRSYVDWLPYRHTEKRAEAFFCNGLPFTRLENPDKRQLEHQSMIRNALAHKSHHAKRMFEQEVLAGLPLTTREKTPHGFLRSSITPVQTRYDYLVGELAAIAQKMCR
jgi:hypothetical protein